MPPDRTRIRLDQRLVELGLAESRSRAQALIAAGLVTVDGTVADKASRAVPPAAAVRLTGSDHPWVSRGGVKLDHGLSRFGVSAAGKLALDLGASTGGFTEVLLVHGAARVHAVDVGHGQLAAKLRDDPRVTVHERVNARYLSRADVPEPVDLLVCDASFIGLETLLPAPLALTAAAAEALVLVKPQFEVGPDAVGKGGIVRDPALHEAVCARLSAWFDRQPGWAVQGLADSPILGPDGNKEFLLHARKRL